MDKKIMRLVAASAVLCFASLQASAKCDMRKVMQLASAFAPHIEIADLPLPFDTAEGFPSGDRAVKMVDGSVVQITARIRFERIDRVGDSFKRVEVGQRDVVFKMSRNDLLQAGFAVTKEGAILENATAAAATVSDLDITHAVGLIYKDIGSEIKAKTAFANFAKQWAENN